MRLVAVATVALLAAACGQTTTSAPAQAPAPLATAAAELREVDLTTSAEAVVEAVRQSTVSAQIAGRIVDIRFDVGDRVNKGDVIVRIDPRYFRPTEVETLLGDPTKAREKLGWVATTPFEELVREMVRTDLEIAERDALVAREGYRVFSHHE